MTKMESKVYEVVEAVCQPFATPTHEDRSDIARIAARILDNKHNINCARDDTKAGDYLAEALDKYLY